MENNKKNQNDEFISHSPLKNMKKVVEKKKSKEMFSPTGVRSPSTKKKKIMNSNLFETEFKKYMESDLYSFNFRKLLDVEYDVKEFDPYFFISCLPRHVPVTNYCLPAKKSKHPVTLVLDLDETLVHCATFGMKDFDMIFPVHFNSIEYKVYVKKRPFFHEFLQICSEMFEVVVFTASHKSYANKLLNLIDKECALIHHRIFRDSCVLVEGNYLKDLTALGRDLKKTVIVDNSPTAFGYQLDNGIPIISWYEDKKDRELLKLIPFLKNLSNVNDVRPIIKDKFKFENIISEYRNKRKI